MTTPFFAMGRRELDAAQQLGRRFAECPRVGCGKRHRIIDSKPAGMLQTVRCRGKAYLVGLFSKRVR